MKQIILGANFLKRFCFGLLIGVACITPGLSGGVIAAATGLYEPAVRAIVNLKKNFRQNALYLLAPALGAGMGILLFSQIMRELITMAEAAIIYVFLGLVAGGVPALVKEANHEGFRLKYLWVALVAFGAVISIGQIVLWSPNPSANAGLNDVNTLFCGAILAFGAIVPGISSSFILIYLGVYEKILAAIAGFDLRILALLAAGFTATALLMIRLVEAFFRRWRGCAYYTVIGFLFGSMVMIFPGLRAGWELVTDFALFASATGASFATTRLNHQ